MKHSPVILIGASLMLSACATEGLDFNTVSNKTEIALKQKPNLQLSSEDTQRATEEARTLLHKKTISQETAVEVALLNNRTLQAAYARLGLSALDVQEAKTLPNPKASLGLIGIRNPEFAAYKAIEGAVVANILSILTQPQRTKNAQEAYKQAEWQTVSTILQTARETREAWVKTVAANEKATLLENAQISAEAKAELAEKLGKTGAFTKYRQAREFVTSAEFAAAKAQARLNAELSKQNLARLMGVWQEDIVFYVPNRLPSLPKKLRSVTTLEKEALTQNAELSAQKAHLEGLLQQYKLIEAIKLVPDLEWVAGFEIEKEKQDERIKKQRTAKAEIEFIIPLFDQGQLANKRATLEVMEASHTLAALAVETRSRVKSAATAYQGSHKIARHYLSTVLPLHKTINEQALLNYNGMITSAFDLLNDAKSEVNAKLEAVNAKEAFFLAESALNAAIYGGGGNVSTTTVTLAKNTEKPH